MDASVAVKWFVEEDGRDSAMEIVRSGEILAAPDIVVFEVLNVLRRKQRQGLVDARQVTGAMEMMTLCFSHLIPSTELAREAVKMSMALDHSVYDCAYLACSSQWGRLSSPRTTFSQPKSPEPKSALLSKFSGIFSPGRLLSQSFSLRRPFHG